MEVYDDVLSGPDEGGGLVLRYNGWRRVPPEVFAHAATLTRIDLSCNALTELGPAFGRLGMLRELDASHNRLGRVDPALFAGCLRLRRLNLSDNLLTSLPPELCRCMALESLRCGNNRLNEVPDDLATLPALEELILDCNNLAEIPSPLGLVPTLRVLTCGGNTELASIPKQMRSHSALVLWCLRMQNSYEERIRSSTRRVEELTVDLYRESRDARELEGQVALLEDEIRRLGHERPVVYLRYKMRLVGMKDRCVMMGRQAMRSMAMVSCLRGGDVESDNTIPLQKGG